MTNSQVRWVLLCDFYKTDGRYGVVDPVRISKRKIDVKAIGWKNDRRREVHASELLPLFRFRSDQLDLSS